MSKIRQRGWFFIGGGLLGLALLTSCEKSKWGLQAIELMETVEFSEHRQNIELVYKCKKSTPRFEFRLFYPEIEFERYHSFEQKDAILRSLDGFEFKLFDMESEMQIADYRVDYSEGHHGRAFNENKPLSLWLKSRIEVKRNRNYRIVMSIPPLDTTDAALTKPILVGGIAEKVSL